MKNFFKEIKMNFNLDYKAYILIFVCCFFITFITVNILKSPSDSESLVIYSNYNFTEDSKKDIKNMFHEIESLEVYYDANIDTTRFGTTGIMISDMFILNEQALEIIKYDLASIMLPIEDSYYIEIPFDSVFYSLYDTEEKLFILINKNSSNITDIHNEVNELIEYWLIKEV